MTESLVVESRVRDVLTERARRRRLVLWSGIGLCILLLGVTIQRSLRHMAAASRLQSQGLEVDWYFDQRPFWKGGSCTVTYHVRPFDRMERLSHRDFESLKDLARIEVLDFTGYSSLSDLDIAAIGPIVSLHELRVPYEGKQRGRGPITDRSLETIAQMKGLKILCLSGQKITDAGIPKLKGLDQVEELDLDYTMVTDAGLASFVALPQLKYLRLEGTRVTPEGIANLQKMAPQVTVFGLLGE